MKKFDVYISYSRHDIVVASRFKEFLRYQGVSCFFDCEDMPGGVDFAKYIQSVIEGSRIVLYLYSSSSENSMWNRRELDYAISLGKKVIPIMLEEPKEGAIPFVIADIQYCPYYSLSENDAFESVLLGIRHFLESDDEGNPVVEPQQQEQDFQRGQKRGRLGKILLYFIICAVIAVILSPLCILPSPSDRGVSNSSFCDDTTSVEQPLELPVTSSDDLPSLPSEGMWLMCIVSLLLGIILCGLIVLLLRLRKKGENLKLSCDIGAIVYIDGEQKADLEAGEIYSMHLNKGEYFIDYESKEEVPNKMRFVQKIGDKEDCHAVYAEFQNGSSGNFAKKIKCFIAGSTELVAERDALRSVIAVMYNRLENSNVHISSYTFEDFSRKAVVGGQQKLYNAFIAEDADWAIFIIADGVGDHTLDEYRIAMDSLKKNGHPNILSFAHAASVENPQVAEMKREMDKEKQYWIMYDSIDKMKLEFESCLSADLLQFQMQRKKK